MTTSAHREKIRRLDTIDFREGPETFKMLEQHFANAFGFCVIARQTIHQCDRDLCGKKVVVLLERCEHSARPSAREGHLQNHKR